MSILLKKSSSAKEWQKQELKNCGSNPIYFLNKYVWIQSKGGRSLFKTFPFQDDCLTKIRNNRFVIINKSRQLGLSTLVSGYAIWLALFRRDQNILVLATKLETAKNFIKKCKFSLENLPPWMMIAEIQCNAQDISFSSNGSQIKAIPTSEDAGRSEALQLLIVDEAAHIKEFDKLWTGLLPTLSYSGGRAVLISSPNGTGNVFHDICVEARDTPEKSEFEYVELLWNVHPERNDAWFEEEKKKFNEKQLAQEYMCSFNSSGNTFLDNRTLDRLKNDIKPPIERWHGDRNLWVWELPKENHKYILSADTALGEGRDYSAFHVIDQTAGEVVAEYMGKEPPDRFAELINQVGLKYNVAVVCPENNSVGQATLLRLRQLKYPKLYRTDNQSTDLWTMVNVGETIKEIGFNMNGYNRTNVLSKLEEVIRNNNIKLYSERTYQQLMSFIFKDNNKVSAATGKNDDLVMSLSIGIWLYETGAFTQFDSDMSKALLKTLSVDSVSKEQLKGENQTEDFRVFVPSMAESLGLAAGTREQRSVRPSSVVNKNWLWMYK